MTKVEAIRNIRLVPNGTQRGAVVQSVRIPACHAGGRGFESRPFRQLSRDNEAPEGAFFMPEFYLPANIRYN